MQIALDKLIKTLMFDNPTLEGKIAIVKSRRATNALFIADVPVIGTPTRFCLYNYELGTIVVGNKDWFNLLQTSTK